MDVKEKGKTSKFLPVLMFIVNKKTVSKYTTKKINKYQTFQNAFYKADTYVDY
jgi:hypothetical protein